LAERARHERFIVARSISAVLGLAALPPVLLWRGVPTPLEILAFVALVGPVVAVAILSRRGGLARAQALASLALLPFAAGLCASFDGAATPAALILLALPLDAVSVGSWRAFAATCAVAALGFMVSLMFSPLALGLEGLPGAPAESATVGIAVAGFMAFGHAIAVLAVDLRFKALLRDAARSGETRESAALQAIDDLVTWHDRNGGVLRASASATRLLGVSPKALEGRGLFARVLVADRPAFLKAVSDAAMSDGPVVVELRLVREESGEVVPVEMHANRLSTLGAARVVAVTRNAGAHRLEVDALHTARAAAESRNAAQAELLQQAADSLGRPLGTLVNFSTLLAADSRMAPATADTRRGYADRVRGAGERLEGLVTVLGELSAIENRRYPFAPGPLDLLTLIAERCAAAGDACSGRGVILVQDLASNLDPLLADAQGIRRLIDVLLGEAIAAAPSGARVTVRARAEANRIVFAVMGTREAGSTPDSLPKALAQAIAELHGGSLALTQVRGLWTATLALPVGVFAASRAGTPVSHRAISVGSDLSLLKRAG
jgi:cell cycle sensor histidine kinase DivJ